MRMFVLASAFALFGATAVAQTPGGTDAPTRVGPSGVDPDQVVCVREHRIGSRLAIRRVCRTNAEWAAHRRMYRDEIERAQREMQTQQRPAACGDAPGC